MRAVKTIVGVCCTINILAGLPLGKTSPILPSKEEGQ